ncbi:hypothetical protein [Desulfonatronovibrio magnus]|uniref:hypothetical protein n=1 Tax=Desulfonatronovibrio magnus TaxID=698827 RepID=UPI000697F96B|nr:hypothetical protein [Desulfonatronovibrio magnus]
MRFIVNLILYHVDVIDVNDVTPYLGLGWGTNFGVDRNWFFTFDLGVLYHGSPSISLKAENPLNLDILNEDIRREIKDIESDVKNYRWYPVVALGFTYRF